ncbi:MAG TPA: lytic transglycosylase domain-containing protein [Candidatus Limnocylindrales bacterium]|nr:lytic transglycosylase domain-containing protein [Candidatus Limnocylindrales bacterium]
MTRLPRLLRFPLVTPILAIALLATQHPALARGPARPAPLSRVQAKRLLVQAARHHGVNPNFVLAVSYWESGWNQAAVSRTGAIGLMQIEPATAAWAGPRYFHRRMNLRNPVDNAELGAALLRSYLDRLHDPKLVLAAYYQGLQAVQRHGIYPGSRAYVDGIWRLRNRFQAGQIPA